MRRQRECIEDFVSVFDFTSAAVRAKSLVASRT